MKKILFTFLLITSFNTFSQDAFITKWKTNANNETIYIKALKDSQNIFNYSVSWGDGTSSNNLTESTSHTYVNPGVFTVTISGSFPKIDFEYNKNIIDIVQWGSTAWTSLRDAFSNCTNLNISAIDSPNLSKVTDLSFMFYKATSLTSDLNEWDVSTITKMEHMFSWATSFNGNISNWNVSNVKSMISMFENADSFNQSLNSWDVSNVTTMESMFSYTDIFNGDISNWDVSKVTDMSFMFEYAIKYNQEMNLWNVQNVKDFSSMFSVATDFNKDLNSWNVSNVTNMESMFAYADNFNGNITSWDTGKVFRMLGMFANAKAFNQNINNWDVRNVTVMGNMFQNATSFNQNIKDWNVENVVEMSNMFSGAISFDQNIGNWNISNVLFMFNMFKGVKLSTDNYDLILKGWSNLSNINSNVNFDGGNSNYCNSETEKNNLILKGWTIKDAGKDCSLSISEYFLTSDFIQIYPNPTSGIIKLKDVINKDIQYIKVVDLLGKIYKTSSNNSIDIEDLKPGVYFLKIKIQDKILKRKIIKE